MAAALLAYGVPAYAQEEIRLLRDTETEEMLRSYETPLARAAGLDPVAARSGWWATGRSTPLPPMAMAARTSSSSPASCSGCRTPNELIGVMAHETGHISAGHLSRGSYGMKKAMIPMLLSMVVGAGRDDRGRRRSRHGDHGHRPGLCRGTVRGLHPGAGIHRRPDRRQAAAGHASVADGHVRHLPALRGRRSQERLQARQVCRRPSQSARTASST